MTYSPNLFVLLSRLQRSAVEAPLYLASCAAPALVRHPIATASSLRSWAFTRLCDPLPPVLPEARL